MSARFWWASGSRVWFIYGLLWLWGRVQAAEKICAEEVSKIAQTRRIAFGRLYCSSKNWQTGGPYDAQANELCASA